MKKAVALRLGLALLIVVGLLGYSARGSYSADAPKVTPVGQLPANITEEANKNFKAGKKLFIWKDKNTTIDLTTTVQLDFIIIDGISVLASPQADEMVYTPCYNFLATNKTTGQVSNLKGKAVGEATKSIASNKERRFVVVVIGGGGYTYSGKPTFNIFLADRNDKDSNPTPISNTIEITADLDKLKSQR